MKKTKLSLLLFFFGCAQFGIAQDQSSDYLEFNDRKNVVHGVYLGLTMRYGEVKSKSSYLAGLTLAYVANQQFEVGFAGNFLYSEQDVFNNELSRNEDLIGVYGGLHLEPIFFSKSRVNLSFPVLVGAGGVDYINNDFNDPYFEEELDEDDEVFFVVEPGVSLLFNVSRYLQFEAGIHYRFTSQVDFVPNGINNVNGFSAGLGIKVGVFNMGRNRYKKKV